MNSSETPIFYYTGNYILPSVRESLGVSTAVIRKLVGGFEPAKKVAEEIWQREVTDRALRFSIEQFRRIRRHVVYRRSPTLKVA